MSLNMRGFRDIGRLGGSYLLAGFFLGSGWVRDVSIHVVDKLKYTIWSR